MNSVIPVKTGIQYLSDSGKIEEDTMENPLKPQLIKESDIVADDSRAVLEEFERFEEDLSFYDLSIEDCKE